MSLKLGKEPEPATDASYGQLFVGTDGVLKVKGPTGLVLPVAAVALPFGVFDGGLEDGDPHITAANAGIQSIARTSGEAVGDWTITLSAPVQGSLSPLNGMLPVIYHVGGSSNPISSDCSFVGGGFPYSQVQVKIKNSGGTPVDAFFQMGLILV